MSKKPRYVFRGMVPPRSLKKPLEERRVSRCTALTRLNTKRILSKALKDYTRAEATVEQLRAALKAHEEEDVPGFTRWLHQTFGRQLTRQRELADSIKDRQALLFEVEDLELRFGLPLGAAYRKALHRRANPAEAEAEDRRFYEEAQRQDEARRAAEEKRRGRQAADETKPDADFDDDDFSSEAEWEAFCQFYETFTGERPPPRQKPPREQAPPPVSGEAKDAYRSIVRRLHPDMNGQMDEFREGLWHEAQEAYRRNDVAALHTILGRCDGESKPGTHSPVSLIQAMTRQLKKTAKELRSSMGRLKTLPAWGFRTRVKDPGFHRRIEQRLEEETWIMEHDFEALDREVKRLEKLSTRVPPKRRPTRLPRQDEFSFP